MKKQTLKAAISAGREERPVAKLVQLAGNYESSIYLETESKRINAKSMMGMMTMDLLSGLEVTVSAEGKDEDKALQAMVEFLSGQKGK